MRINYFSEIDFSSGQQIEFEGTIVSITTEGNVQEKKPLKYVMKMESTGELVIMVSWSSGLLSVVKDGLDNLNVYEVTGIPRSFNNFNEVRVGQMKATGKESTKKTIHKNDFDFMRKELISLLNRHISETSVFKGLVDSLICNNENFFVWPAATRVHHAYPGGLLKHSLGVVKNAISFWENYSGENLNLELLVAASALHDIGKLTEYKADGSRTFFGDMVPHPVSGADMISKYCDANGINPNTDKNILALRHILLSHHDKLEFGAATRPNIPEAYVVAMCDENDAKMEAINFGLLNLETGAHTGKLISLDEGKVTKWQ